jgi:hypothetical protein
MFLKKRQFKRLDEEGSIKAYIIWGVKRSYRRKQKTLTR